MLDNFYRFNSRYGELFIYGDNLSICRPYIETMYFETIESLCIYCKQHDLRIFYLPERTLRGLWENPRVLRLTLKYSVYSSWTNVEKHINAHPELRRLLE